MAQRSATLEVVGNVVKSEHKHGEMPARDNPTETITWDYIEARVLTQEYDAVDVRFPSDGSIPVPSRDETVNLRVDARPSMGNLKLTVTQVRDLNRVPLTPAVAGK